MVVRPALRTSGGILPSFLHAKASCRILTRTSPSPFQPLQSHRSAHSVPSIGSYDEQFKREGVPGLFSSQAYDVAWTQYQTHVVNRLNDLLTVNGDPRAGPSWDAKTILLSSARDPSQAALFNHASMAHNNHFFFHTITPQETRPSPELTNYINRSFTSLETFKTELLTTAGSMFGPGFVWLVQQRNPSPGHPSVHSSIVESASPRHVHLRLLVTYLAGSPYPGAHNRQQGQDMNTQNILSTADEYDRLRSPQNGLTDFGPFGGRSGTPSYRSSNSFLNRATQEGSADAGAPRGAAAGAMGMDSLGYETGAPSRSPSPSRPPVAPLLTKEKPRYGGADIVPLLCVNTWQHCYLHDFGVAGKMEYLERWWDRINWDTVWANVDRPNHMR